MSFLLTIPHRLNLLHNTLYFIKKHFGVVMGLSLIAAFGRVVQLRGFGEISSWFHVVLEIIIESARILLFVYVLGYANIQNGLVRIRRFFADKQSRKLYLATAIQKLKQQWVTILFNLALFLAIAWAFNYLIDLVTYETCLYLKLKEEGILVSSSSEWTIVLFFKNLSVIPFTLIFETVFLLWLANKFQYQTTHSPM